MIKHKLIYILFFSLYFTTAFGIDVTENNTSSLDRRYHIIQSSIAVKDTFRIDTYTGTIWELVLNKDKKQTWQKVIVIGTRPAYQKPTYQVFLSGMKRSTNTMIDTATGNTFEFFVDSETEATFLSEFK